MAQVIKFPVKRRKTEWLGSSTRQRCITALEFVANNMRSGKVAPTEMFIMYGTRDGTETIWSYLNLGFESDGLTKAMCRVLDDVEERSDEPNNDFEW